MRDGATNVYLFSHTRPKLDSDCIIQVNAYNLKGAGNIDDKFHCSYVVILDDLFPNFFIILNAPLIAFQKRIIY